MGCFIRPAAWGLFLLLGLLAEASACDSTASDTSSSGEDAGADATRPSDDAGRDAADAADVATCTLPGVFGNDECQRCMSTRCCGPVEACEADPACKPLLACVITCFPKPDAGGCRSDCEAKNPGGSALLDDAALCFGRKSDAGCGELCVAP